MDQERVARMRQLLAEASAPKHHKHPEALTAFLYRDTQPVRTTLRRRAVIKDLQVATRDYGFDLDVQAFLAAADVASLSGLETSQLLLLSNWVAQKIDQLNVAADPPEIPVAR